MPDVAQNVPGGLGSQISWHSAREGGEVVSLTHRPPLPPGMFLVLILTRGWVDPRTMVRSEGNTSLKNPVTPPGIDPEAVRLVAQRLNHYYGHNCKGKVYPREGHKGPKGESKYSSTLSLTSVLNGVGGQRHAPAALPPRKNRYSLYRRLGRLQGRSGRVRKFSPSPEFDPQTIQPVVIRYTDWAIPANQV